MTSEESERDVRGVLEPLPPLLVADRFPLLGEALVSLLESLSDAQWRLPTVCAAWSVQDVAAHLLDTGLRRLSLERDGQGLPEPGTPIAGYRDLVAFLNELNARWVDVARRLSPRLLTELLAFVEPRLAAHLAALDPWAPARFPVAWAGESESRTWFDVARELTERWHHQQQIRLAVGAEPLSDPWLAEPVFDAFLRVLPHLYRGVAAAEGTTLAVRIEGARSYAYALRRSGAGWELGRGEEAAAAARIVLGEEPAWLLLTKGLDGEAAMRAATIEGEEKLARPFFAAVAVMA